MTFVAIIVYIILQIVLLPLGLLGALLVAYKQIRVSQRLGLSQTAVEVINGRWTMDVFGIREDKASRKLARSLPNNSTFGLRLALLPLYILYKMTGKNLIYPRVPQEGRESIADMMIVRTLHIDPIIDSHLDSATQFVVLGAGLDTRAYGPLKDRDIKMFELDQANVQQMKRKQLKKSRLRSDHVRFVEVDFTLEHWMEGLLATDYDPSAKTIFLWEGVTLYLSGEDVSNTLDAIKSVSAAGSVVVLDIYAERFLKFANKGAAARTLEMTGEELGFGLDFSSDHEARLSAYISSLNLQLGKRHFLGTKDKKGPYMAVLEATI